MNGHGKVGSAIGYAGPAMRTAVEATVQKILPILHKHEEGPGDLSSTHFGKYSVRRTNR